MGSETLSRAIVAWHDDAPAPTFDDDKLAREFGADAAQRLLPDLKRLVDDFYESEARHKVADLAGMADEAASEFREKHPEISEEAVQVLANHYAFDFK